MSCAEQLVDAHGAIVILLIVGWLLAIALVAVIVSALRDAGLFSL
jgi:hypothetical protein